MENNSLKHSGVKGMKWGVRRYQNPDGTLTDLGKRRQGYEQRNPKGDKKNKKVSDNPNDWVTDDYRDYSNISSSVGRLSNDAKNSVRSIPTKRQKINLDHMSDKELNDRINRELLERRYNDIFSTPSKAEKGKKYVANTLAVAGSLAALATSSLAIAIQIRELKNKSS